jgi:subtilisin family serine protease
VTNASRLLRGTVPCLVALAVATGFVLPASAAQAASAAPAAGIPGATRGAEWWLTLLGLPGAWKSAPAQGGGVTVAVLSTGVEAANKDLAGSVIVGPDYSDSGRTAASPFWGNEGTAVASLIAGHGHGPGGADGITGVAPHARILAIQVTLEYDDPLNADHAITTRLADAIGAGIRYAVSHGATVIALPLDPGTLGPPASGDPAAAGGSPAEQAAVRYAVAHDVVLIAPAGDNGAGTGSVNYPAAYPGVLAVGATERDGQLAPFTSRLSYVALTAPGSGLIVADPAGGYQTLSTTDMSTALTAGVAALIRSRFPLLTAAQVARALEAGARPPGAHPAAGNGHGALDAREALVIAASLAAIRPAPPLSTATATARPLVSKPNPPRQAASAAGAGDLATTLVRDLVIAVCVLIAALACALAVIARRRSVRFARQAPPRSGQGGSHARRSQPTTVRQLPARQPRAVGWDQSSAFGGGAATGTPRIVPGAVIRTLGTASAAHRRRKPTGQPPWEPAAPPESPPTASRPLPLTPLVTGQPPAREPGALPPWEQSPDEFAAAPVPADVPDWSPTNSGPMYLWNPNASTAPQPVIPDDET